MPLKTYSKYIPLIVKDLSVEYQLYLILNKFLWKLNQSNNTSVQLCNTLMQNGSNSNICKSFTHMSYRFNLDRICMSPRLFRKAMEVDHEQIYDEFHYITTSVGSI